MSCSRLNPNRFFLRVELIVYIRLFGFCKCDVGGVVVVT
jgi:hypothetical protein